MFGEALARKVGLLPEELRDSAELLGKAALGVLALSYALGLTIVNLHLRRYGVFSVGLVRVEYILAGVLWLAFLALGLSLVHIFLWARRNVLRAFREKRFGMALLDIFLGCLVLPLSIPLLPLRFLSDYTLHYDSWRIWVAEAVILSMAVSVKVLSSLGKSIAAISKN